MLSSIINLKTLNAVNIAASKKDTRYYLNGVLVECRADSVTYVATDGHRMLVVQEDFSEADLERLNESGHKRLIGNFIVPSDAILALKPKKTRGAQDTALMSAESPTSAKATLGDRIVTFIDGTFPDWHRVVPGPKETAALAIVAHFNPSYVADFGKFAKAMDWPEVSARIQYTAHDFPHAVTFGQDRKAFGVLMPMRTHSEGWEGAPAWINEKRAKSETMAAE